MPSHINSQTAKTGKTALLLGVGYVASRLAPTLVRQGYDVLGTTRSNDPTGELEKCGITPIVIKNLNEPELRDAFEQADLILSSISPKKLSDVNGFYDPVLQGLNQAKINAKWVGYLSATSVYGNRAGQWAFEGESPTPSLKRGRARAEAEMEWLETLWPVHIFRLAGIYGPGRAPFEKLKTGDARAVIKEGHVVNRIHVDDIVSAVMASIAAPSPQRIYNIADGHPAPPQDVLDYAAKLIGAKKPPRVGMDDESVSKMARSFYSETKRVDISRAKRELDWSPKYRDYKDGLRATLDAEA
ncbi:SDR family oxidoreductase [Litorimonas haliclonae]|uniref:SDR family oxidoreductase n=1 Tax=Litorimonas haliclonae TaxID=2081977 RepID=UPI0039EE2319